MTIIRDGVGTGNTAKVDNTNKLAVRGVTEDNFVDASLTGDGWFIHSNKVTLTSACVSFINYISNCSDKDIVLISTTVHLGNSTGGSGDIEVKVIVNPTGGTILTACLGFPINNNLASSTTFDGVFRIGVEGTTATGAFPAVTQIIASPGVENFPSSIVLPKGASITTGITPPTGNTSMNVVVEYLLYFRDRSL